MSKASPELPAGWVKYVDKASGDPYYHNAELNETTWDHPGRWKVGLFFDSLREAQREAAAQRKAAAAAGSSETGGPKSRLQRLLGGKSEGEEAKWSSSEEGRDYEWGACEGEDDVALRRRLTERIEYLRAEYARREDGSQIAELREELGRRRERLERLREALEAEKRKAAELVVAAGGAARVQRRREDAASFSREEEVRSLRLQVADLRRELEARDEPADDVNLDELDETMLDVDAAIEDAAVLAEAGVDSRLAQLLRTRPWADEVVSSAVAHAVALEWQARSAPSVVDDDEEEDMAVIGGGVAQTPPRRGGAPEWLSPLDLPPGVAIAAPPDLAVPVALRRAKPRVARLLAGKRASLFTDASASETYDTLERAASLPGSCWQWLGGWRVEGGGDGWIYGDLATLVGAACADDDSRGPLHVPGSDDVAPNARDAPPLRCRRWRRTRALVKPPAAPDSKVCVVAKKVLELKAHAASLEVLAAKLSDQLVSTRAALDASERKAARLPALEAALVETSSMLRDTELRRDALQRQLVASAGIQAHADRPANHVVSPPNEYFFTPDPQTNNPFVDRRASPPPPPPPVDRDDSQQLPPAAKPPLLQDAAAAANDELKEPDSSLADPPLSSVTSPKDDDDDTVEL